ncbi:MAG: ChaN family lipoprotein [Bacteroidales bacterium]|jgi:uncharacterized iron-regulated protein|nr:ChaN family lipoprotein [Bacteroidales bacterium]
MKKTILPLLLAAFIMLAMKADKKAYQLYTVNGKSTTYAKMLKKALEADVILFGELHNNPVCHWLQYELTSDLFEEKKDDLVLGAEMFERDGQLILDEYVSGKISTRSFETQARLWPNYETDYKPLVEFAKAKGLPFIATNIPRRYASIVFKGGFEALDSLGQHAKMFFPPLPVAYDPELPGYLAMLDMGGGMGGHASENFPKAQAIKDATMAYFITQNLPDGKLFIHYHGTYHSNNFEGIMWYLNEYQPGLNIMTIASVEQDDINELEEENEALADFILVIPASMTKTH